MESIVDRWASILHNASSYRTKANPARYSESGVNAFRLKMLSILRTLPMLRTLTFVLVLAALSVTSANGSPVHPVKAHRNAPPKATSHNAPTKAHHATPQEVGRAAGLKIRRELARHPAAVATQHRPARILPLRSHRQVVAASIPQRNVEFSMRRTEVAFLEAARPDRRLKTPRRVTAPPAPESEIPVDEAAGPAEEYAAPVRETVASEGENAATTAEAEFSVEAASAPVRRAGMMAASLHLKRGAILPALLGSRASLERQNTKTEAEGLERIEDEDDLADRIARKMLVPVPASLALTVNGNLPVNHRYCRPWTAHFLADLAQSHAAEFHRPLEVSSAVRTVDYQKRLMGINGNAAAAEGDIVSPHLTGATIDIAKSPLSREELGWMRSRLLALEVAGKIDVEEEFQQSCFHITVYKSYAPPAPEATRKPRLRRHARRAETTDRGL